MVNECNLNDVLVRPNTYDPEADDDKTTTTTWSSGPAAAMLGQFRDGATTRDSSMDVSTDGSGEVRRAKWGRSIEFLLSCVALSVGFGNVWRFPQVAMENGGGAFMIPYLIILFLVGRPMYYLEMVMGQFSSRGCVKVFDLSPLMRGVGVGQTLIMALILGFYSAVLSISVRYLIASFSSTLPWARCSSDWTNCVNSESLTRVFNSTTHRPSAEFYFNEDIIHSESIKESGVLGWPDYNLALCLLFCWICITVILIRGIRSSGKAAYFLAIFPYVILLVLLVQVCSLEGAWDGISFLLKPQWEKLLDVKVWQAAVTQCFFSLTISLGAVIVFSSYNNFSNNIYRDSMIISWLDTFTSLMSGFIVFGILGNIASITGNTVETLKETLKLGGPGLTFITYPDAIAKLEAGRNVFAVLFFLMFFLLGLGSNTGIVTTIVSGVKDRYPQLTDWKVVSVVSIYGFSTGLIYITPGGFDVLGVVNDYGVELTVLTLVILEIVTFCWVYGVNRICHDIKFMLDISTGIFWRVCWGFVTFTIIFTIWIFSMKNFTAHDVPDGLNALGWCLFALVVVQVPLWAVYAVSKRTETGLAKKIIAASHPTPDWGPESPSTQMQYKTEVRKRAEEKLASGKSIGTRLCPIFSE
ncbi:sodium-dependent nutrient amino acid transporter 3 [Anopheles sinensis]|uniref:Sodium-dependent nutrient amino acid transporter 1 n=1 Tax=Anopheles sinensis TaxID=74873 RepID=A0A084WUQ4_ANOSI|nr:sodium-dependent nutrient amino acid transporter 3 [Anopheles sinensis]